MIANPILRKEVLSALRTRKAVAMPALFLLVTMGLIVLFWPKDGLQAVGGKDAAHILSVLAIGELLMAALFAPAFTAAALTSERERNTLESLFATALKPWEIAVGKMVGALAFLVLLVVLGSAGLAAPLLLGGVDGTQVLAVLGVLLLTAVYLGMLGLLVSTFMHRSYRAIIVTYSILLVVVFLAALPAWPISGHLIQRGPPAWQGLLHVIASLSPLEAMLSVVWPDSPYAVGAGGMPAFWQLFIPLSLLVIAAAAGVCLFRLRRPIAAPRPRERLKVVEGVKVNARGLLYLFFFDPARRKGNIRWWQNPILVKEFRTRPILQTQWLLRAVSVCLIVSILLVFLVSISTSVMVSETSDQLSMMAVAVAVMMVSIIVLVGPATTSGAICSDLETGVWELIQSTRLSSWRIVSGKFQASVIPLLLLPLAMAPALVILLYFNVDLYMNVLRALAVTGMTVLFVATAGMFFSSLFRKTSTATAWTYGLIIIIGLLSLLMLLGQHRFSERLVRTVLILNPVAAAMDAAGQPDLRKLGLLRPHLLTMACLTAAMFVVTTVRVFQLRRPR